MDQLNTLLFAAAKSYAIRRMARIQHSTRGSIDSLRRSAGECRRTSTPVARDESESCHVTFRELLEFALSVLLTVQAGLSLQISTYVIRGK